MATLGSIPDPPTPTKQEHCQDFVPFLLLKAYATLHLSLQLYPNAWVSMDSAVDSATCRSRIFRGEKCISTKRACHYSLTNTGQCGMSGIHSHCIMSEKPHEGLKCAGGLRRLGTPTTPLNTKGLSILRLWHPQIEAVPEPVPVRCRGMAVCTGIADVMPIFLNSQLCFY